MDIQFIVNLALAMQRATYLNKRTFEYVPNGYFELRTSRVGAIEAEGFTMYHMELWYGVNVATKPLRPGEPSGYQELRCGPRPVVYVDTREES